MKRFWMSRAVGGFVRILKLWTSRQVSVGVILCLPVIVLAKLHGIGVRVPVVRKPSA
jgi:hypothetical protein